MQKEEIRIEESCQGLSEDESLELIGPKEFKARFAPGMSIAKVRDLFHAEGFPAVFVGGSRHTTLQAARTWLSCMGRTELLVDVRDSGVGQEGWMING